MSSGAGPSAGARVRLQPSASGRRDLGSECRQRVGLRQSVGRSHRRKADHRFEPPDSRRPRSAVPDPSVTFTATTRSLECQHMRTGGIWLKRRLQLIGGPNPRAWSAHCQCFGRPAAWYRVAWQMDCSSESADAASGPASDARRSAVGTTVLAFGAEAPSERQRLGWHA
jgi:hypothetical protein